MKRRILSIILSISVISLSLPINIWSAGSYSDGLCPHHPEHTEDCGYIEAVAGAPCAHEHTDDCYVWVEACVHVHDESCYSDTDETGSSEDEVPVGSEETEAPKDEDGETEIESEETKAPKEEEETDIGAEETEAPEEDEETDIGAEETEVPEEDEETDIGADETEAPEEDEETDIGADENEALEEDDEDTKISVEVDGDLEDNSGEAEMCVHVCTIESSCITLVENCAHTHDESCGYVEPVEGVPCGYICDICAGLSAENNIDEALNAVQAMINALPASEDVLTANKAAQGDVYRLLQEAYNAYKDLTEEQQTKITGLDNFYALLDFFDKQMVQTTVSTAYRDASGDMIDQAAIVVESSDSAVTWTDGWYVVNSDVTISGTVTVSGDVRLILGDGCTLITTRSIRVAGNGNSLSIYCQSRGTGALITGAAGTDPAIDCGRGGGTLLIYGGTVRANGSGSAAGIGSGGSVQANEQKFYVGIYGGHVIARAGGEKTDSNGIGSGGNSDVSVHLMMSGGVVEAYGVNSGVPYLFDVTGGVLIANFSDGLPGKEGTGGLIVDTKSGNGRMYSSVVLDHDVTFPSNCTVDIPSGMTLTVAATLTNNGRITGGGTVDVTDGILYNSGTSGCTAKIEPSDRVYTITAPTAKDGLAYDNSARQLVSGGSVSNGGGKMLYSLDGDAYSETIPTGTDPGTYDIYYKVVPYVSTGAFNGPLSGTISVTVTGYPDNDSISQSNAELPIADDGLKITPPTISDIYVFDTLDNSYLVGGKAVGSDGKEVKGTFSITGVKTWSIGGRTETTTVKFTPDAPLIYQPVDNISVDVNVLKRKVVSIEPSSQGPFFDYKFGTDFDKIYEKLISVGLRINASGAINTGGGRQITASINWSGYNPNTLEEQIIYGEPDLASTVFADVIDNPDNIRVEVIVKLQPLTPGAVTYNPKTVTYTGSQIDHTIDKNNIKGEDGKPSVEEITYTYKGIDTEYDSSEPPTNAGKYNVTAEFKMIYGYDQIPDKTATLIIERKPITGAIVNVPDSVYTGQTQTPEVSVSLEGKPLTYDSEYTYTITKSGESEIKNAGTYTVTVEGRGNYSGTAGTTFKIEQSSPTIAFNDPEPATKIYDKGTIPDPAESDYTITGVTDGKVEITWSGPDIDRKNAGEYTLTLTLKETVNSKGSTATKKFIIEPKKVSNPTIELEPAGFTYNGNSQKPTTVTVKDGDDVIPDTEYSIEYIQQDTTNAGIVTVTISDNPNGNYTVSGTKEYEIARAKLTADMFEYTGPSDLIYTGDEKTVSVELKPEYKDKGVGTVTIKYYDENDNPVESPIKAGKYTVRINVSEGRNYCGAEGLTTFTISYLKGPSPEYAYEVEGGYLNNGVRWVNKNKNDTVTITPAAGYMISAELNGKYEPFLSVKEWEYGDFIYLKEIASGHITDGIQVTETIKIDDKGPVGKITLKDKASWDKLLESISFGLFYLDEQTLIVDANDSESGIKKTDGIESFDYYLSRSGPVEDITKDIADIKWLRYDNSVSLSEDDKYVLYVRITDNVGNVTYISSDGIVIYTNAEQDTESIEYTKTTKTDVKADVKSNGNTIKEIRLDKTTVLRANTDYTLSTEENKVTSITFKGNWLDRLAAGNYTLTVYYNPLGMEYKEKYGNDEPATTEIALSVFKAEQAKLEIVDPGPVMVFDDVFTLNYTGGSGTGKVTWRVERGNAVIDENTGKVTITGVGEVKIVAFKAADDNYNSTSDEITFTVQPKTVNAYVEVLGGPFTYAEGKEIKPNIIAWDRDRDTPKVIPASEYTVKYSNNIAVGTATITLIDNAGGNYIVSGATTFEIDKAKWEEPGVLVNYIDEILVSTDTTSRKIEFADNPNGPWTVFADGMSVVESGWGITDNVIYIRFREDGNHISEIQELFIPARRDHPYDRIAVTKSSTSIIITNTDEHNGLEYSIDGKNWNEHGLFAGLTPNTEYTLYIRYKAIDPVFKSRSMTLALKETQGAFASYSTTVKVITVGEDGRTVLMPNETVETENGTITNNKDDVTVTDKEGNIADTVTPPEGEDFADGIEIGNDDDITIPDGSTVHPGNGGPDITVGPGNDGVLDKDGNVRLPGGGNAQLDDTTVTMPEDGGTLTPNDNGRVDLPAGSVAEKDGNITSIPEYGGFYDSTTGETHSNYYTVTLFRHENDIEEIHIAYGDTFAKPDNPARRGYKYQGWFTDPNYKCRYDFRLPVTHDLTLYVRWTEYDDEVGERRKSNSTNKDESPRTGSNIALHLLLTGISGMIAIVVALRKPKED